MMHSVELFLTDRVSHLEVIVDCLDSDSSDLESGLRLSLMTDYQQEMELIYPKAKDKNEFW